MELEGLYYIIQHASVLQSYNTASADDLEKYNLSIDFLGAEWIKLTFGKIKRIFLVGGWYRRIWRGRIGQKPGFNGMNI